MKWTVEYTQVDEITVEADTEDEALKLAQDKLPDEFTIVDNRWKVFEEIEE